MTFWNVALWIYEFSAILSFLLLVKFTFKLSKEIDNQMEVKFLGNRPIKTIFLCFWQNFFHIMIPVWNTFMCFVLILISFVPDLDEIMRESVQTGIKKARNEKNLSEDELKALIKEKFGESVDNSDEG